MSEYSDLRCPSSRDLPGRRHGTSFKALAALLAASATMGGITRRTADSPSRPWTPPVKEAKPPEPLPAPSIPAELQAQGRTWTLGDIVDVGLANNPRTR